MINGIYGTVKAANIDIAKDVEIFYRYRPTRNASDEEFANFKQLSSTNLVAANCDNGSSIVSLEGLYNLRLPMNIFNMKGFYTIYIRPKEIEAEVFDTGVLSFDNSVKGVVFRIDELQGVNVNDLPGYRIEYPDSEGSSVKTNIVRLITSSNYAEPIASNNLYSTQAKSNSYRLLTSNSSNLVFCTVTPSTSPSYLPNSTPYIGAAGGKVWLVNTKFNPIMLEVEMVEHDADTISYMLEGDQARDKDKSIITIYNDDREIYHQYEYYTTKDNLGKPLYDIKKRKTDIDGTQNYDNVFGAENYE